MTPIQPTCRVYLACQTPLARDLIANYLEREASIQVVGGSEVADEVIRDVRRLSVDVVLLSERATALKASDLQPHRQDGDGESAVKVVLLAYDSDDMAIARHLRDGAAGCVCFQACPGEELIKAVLAVHQGRLYMGKGISPRVMQLVRDGVEHPLDRLTHRERQVLCMLADGSTSREMAQRLDIALKTVEAHRSSMMNKLQLRNSIDAVKFALRHRLTSTGDPPPLRDGS